ncbi:IS481 family transposase [Streptomyces sp. NBC_00932]|uniref:IS481 family transposase n=1 Tax=Streptomyces sp. NBC_00932 TaxID=2903690 RepID=UPI003869A4D3|nr:IS481 family transposase [Streptomyces sp. NBC_00932]
MPHANAPLSVEGRRRLVKRCRTRPIAHVAAEMGISRATASKWVNRYRHHGKLGLHDRSSTPYRQPTATAPDMVARIEKMRRTDKWSAARIAHELAADETQVSRRTISRHLADLGLNRRKFIDPSGDTNREPQKIVARRPGHMVHVDVKKVGRIPDGGGWRAHGRGSANAEDAERSKTTAIAFMHRARAWFAAHGITYIERIVTDNGACYRADAFARAVLGARHQRITPYTPRHNGKVERYNRIISEEFLYARTWTSENQRREALAVWNIHYNYHRPHTTANGQPPASRLREGVSNVMASSN